MTRSLSPSIVAFGAAMLLVLPAFAANARLERVVLLPAADRSSIVFELTAEPQQVSSRRISDSVVELEAGPGVESAAPQLLKAPANVRFVDSVTVRVVPTAAGPVVRARITLTSAAQAVVRSSGRRVYVDVSQPPAAATAPGPPAPSVQTAHAGAAVAPAPKPARVTVDETFKAAVKPSVDRLKELGPFLISAANDPGVGAAVLPTLTTIRAAMAALQPPEPARGSHTMVLGAVDRIALALSPNFTGDRAAAVRQSMTTIDVVGGVLAGE